MERRILMVAFHFPPVRGSSGVHRTLNFARYLLEDHGWRPTVLTVHPRAYPQTSDDLLAAIPDGVEVVRAFGCDTSRHLSIRGRYLRWMALPDKWISWWLGAVPKGLALIRRQRPDVLWTTYPIATAHRIGLTLARRTRLPWVADFRDSMSEPHYPRDPAKRRAHARIERATVERCTRAVFTTPGTRRMYAERYPEIPGERWAVIENGYDEPSFSAAEALAAAGERPPGPRKLVHAGLLYRSERDPRAFFDALGELKRAGRLDASRLCVVLRASGDEEYHRSHIRKAGVEDLVSLEDALPYREALAEMLAADGLLLFQASNCNHQIPAKVYEYLRARRPILALTDPAGDTAGVLREAGAGTVVPRDDAQAIAAALPGFFGRLDDEAPATDEEIERHSRRARTAELARLLDALPVRNDRTATR